MTHPDLRVAAISERNRKAITEAAKAPPLDVASDFASYLDWCARPPGERPAAPTIPKGTAGVRPRPQLPRTTRTVRHQVRDRQPLPAGPVCGCGTVLDPDGSCFACPKEASRA